jgi:HPt (histidine-containing phosphotransfer) domain-containing protein
MLPNADQAELFFSDLAFEPEMAELVKRFVQILPIRIAAMQQMASAENWDELGRLAHQFKGAAGSYGFPQLASAAEYVEQSARDRRSASDVSIALDRLGAVCSNTRAGIPLS